MLGKLIGAAIGSKMTSRYGTGGRGALMGALAPTIARRLFSPLGLVIGGGYLAKKYYDGRKGRRQTVTD